MTLVEMARDGGVVLGFCIALGTVGGAVGKFLIFEPLRREIEQATRPIQPTANGGLSLPDVAKKLDSFDSWKIQTETKLDLVIDMLRGERGDRH